MNKKAMRLDDMNPALKARVEAAMARQGPWVAPIEVAKARVAGSAQPVPALFCEIQRALTVPPPALAAKGVRSGGTPNKTEAEYNRLYLGGRGRYEAVTLKLAGGSRYTPDWMMVGADGTVELHEVKGSYRFGSQGRALTAFRECVAAFPCFRFVWAVRGKGVKGWDVKRLEAGRPESR